MSELITHNTLALIAQKASEMGLWSKPVAENLLEVSLGDHIEYFDDTITSKTTALAYCVCRNKAFTKKFLEKAEISTPHGGFFCINNKDEALKLIEKIGFPVVAKPAKGLGGDLVFSNINSIEEFSEAWMVIINQYDEVVVEKRFEGTEYRIFATREKTLSIIKRVPAFIVGDGTNTISSLINNENKDPRRNGFFSPLRQIKVDSVVMRHLENQNLSINSIPEKGKKISLRDNSNLSTGGESIDFTNLAHKDVKDIAVKAVQAIPGLPYAGVDFMSNDISSKQDKSNYSIIEINASPGLSLHNCPSQGGGQDIASEILKIIFPETSKESK